MEDTGQPEPEVSDPRVLEKIGLALGRLSDAQQQAVLLMALLGLTRSEAASVCGCELNALDQRLHRARQALRIPLGSLSAVLT